MIRLFLMRHGNTFEAGQTPVQVGARTDLPLTEQGKEQAAWMADYLVAAGLRPAIIYAGPLQRQTQSAQVVADRFGMGVIVERALTEIDYGAWEGLTAEEIAAQWPEEYGAWTRERKWPGNLFGGSLAGHVQNIDRWLNQIEMGAVVLAVTSNGLLQFFRKEKVKTGHFCELCIFADRVQIKNWNTNPQGSA